VLLAIKKLKTTFTPFWLKHSVLLSSQLGKGGTEYTAYKKGFHLSSGTRFPEFLPSCFLVRPCLNLHQSPGCRKGSYVFDQGHGSHLQGCPKEDRLERVLFQKDYSLLRTAQLWRNKETATTARLAAILSSST